MGKTQRRKRNEPSKRTKISLVKDRLLAGIGGIIAIILAGVPLCCIVRIWIGCGGDGKLWLLSLITVPPFVGVVAWGLWDVIRRWREVAEIQRIIGGMTNAERSEFYSAIEQSDVKLVVDGKGKTHSAPLDFG